ncbi:hypothetical protein [Variovorax gossypii]
MSVFNRLLSRRTKALNDASEKPTSAPKASTDASARFQDNQLYPDLVPEGVELIDPEEIEAFFLALDEPAMLMAPGVPAARSPSRLATDSSPAPANTSE